ncbi:hypothetical protein Ndes2526B_g00708 [Nannochloris sp. 'desiccata']|nr:hypothetical protein KSW81_004006 [Chlorella desiccata (nom. nud.)]KAH7624509.1 hypothetical protein NADE_003861 [Chlorella desiccata (nom. nud.)]
MKIPPALPLILLPVVIGIAAMGARSPALASKLEQTYELRNVLNEALKEIKELEEQIYELSQALALEESNTRGLQEQLEKLQDQLNDARDLAFSNISI